MSVLKTVHYTLGDTLDLERERYSMACAALKQGGATNEEIVDAHTGLTVIDGQWHRIIACYVANPTDRVNGS